MSFEIRPVTFKQAKSFVHFEHRHNDEPPGGAFCCALLRDGELVGVGVAGRPISRAIQSQGQGLILEITRCCVLDGVRNGCTRIYGALTRAGKALGYRKALTYTRVDEPGTSLLAAGFRAVAKVKGQKRSRPSRPRKQNEIVDKIRWERDL